MLVRVPTGAATSRRLDHGRLGLSATSQIGAAAPGCRLPRTLRLSLRLGAAYDAAFAILMVTAPALPARLLRLPLPPLPAAAFYLWVMAVLLLMLAAIYLLAASDPARYRGVVAVAAAGRLVGGVALLLASANAAGLAGLYPLAAADLLLGLSHLVAGWPGHRTA
jgi:hypothetical protein